MEVKVLRVENEKNYATFAEKAQEKVQVKKANNHGRWRIALALAALLLVLMLAGAGTAWSTAPTRELQASYSQVAANGRYVLYRDTSQQPVEWDSASAYCSSQLETTLASIPVSASENSLASLAGQLPAVSPTYWIGLVPTNGVGSNNRNDWKWEDGSAYTFQHWMAGQPNNIGGDERCVMTINGNGMDRQWVDFKCNGRPVHALMNAEVEAFACNRAERVGETTNYALYKSKDGITFTESKQYCEANGYKLASFHSVDDRNEVASLVDNLGQYQFIYIGLKVKVDPATIAPSPAGSRGATYWEWDDGTPLDYENWQDNQPWRKDDGYNSQCVVIFGYRQSTANDKYEWNDWNCDGLGGQDQTSVWRIRYLMCSK